MGLITEFKNFFKPPKPGDPPAWFGRLKKASYTSPSGQTVPFEFADLQDSVEKKTTAFESAVGNGTYIQDSGRTSGRFPMVVAVTGNDYDMKAQAFMSALLERGEGILNHPIYGKITVVPFGEISRADNLVSGAGQAIFTVAFYETTGLQIGGGGGVPQLYDSFLDASAVDFSDKLNLGDAADKANFVTKFKAIVQKTKDVMMKISDGQALLQKSVEAIGDSINRGVDLMVGQPLMLARQTQVLIGEPARQAKLIKARIEAYKDLAAQIFEQTFGADKHEKTADKNNFHLSKLVSANVVAAAALSASNNIHTVPRTETTTSTVSELQTRSDLINTAIALQTMLDDYQAWHDAGYVAVEEDTVNESATDTGDGLTELSALISAAMAETIAASFNALTEYRTVLDSDRTPLDLAFEFGTDFNFFCQSNNLSGDEIFIIPRGREVVRYL